MLALLEARPEGLEPEEAADHLGALRRTVYRDLRVLEDIGVPLTSTRDGRRARWRIMPGYRHRLQLSLTFGELLALMTARRALAGLAGTMLHEGAASALDKIRATLPRGLFEQFQAAEGFVTAGEGGRDYSARGEILQQLVEALSERRTIEARYRSRKTGGPRTASARRLDPLHLRVAEDGVYLLARCHRTEAVKSFLLDRFDAVRLTDERFSPPKDQPPERLLGSAFRMWSGRPRKVRFTVGPQVADLLMERKVHPSQIAQRRSDGSVEVSLEVAIGPPLVSYLTGLGAAVSGIEPGELSDHVMKAHQEALKGVAARETRGVTRQG